MEFSTAGINTRSRTFNPRLMIMCAERQHGGGAAHVLFHHQHAARRLDVESAGIEAHALADQRHLGMRRIAPGQVDQPWRIDRRTADRMDQRQLLFQQIVADDRRDRRAVLRRQRTSRRLKMRRPHVVGRRVDQVARERDGLDNARQIFAVDVGGKCQLHVLRLRICDSAKTIGAEREGERREPRVVAGIDELDRCRPEASPAIVRRGTGRGFGLSSLSTANRTPATPLAPGSRRCRPGFRFKAAGVRIGRAQPRPGGSAPPATSRWSQTGSG